MSYPRPSLGHQKSDHNGGVQGHDLVGRKIRRGLVGLAVGSSVLLTVGIPQSAVANPVDAFGIGARGAALAGAQTAASKDSSANYYNPALLARLNDLHIDIGYRVAAPYLTIGGANLGVDTSRGTHIGIAVPGALGPLQVAIGGATFIPDQHLSRVRSLPPGRPRFSLYDNRPQRFFLAANVAIRAGERVWVGAGISFMSNTSGGVVLDGRIGFPDAADSDLSLAIDIDLQTIRYPQAGIAIQVSPWLLVGASYRGQFNLVSDLHIRLQGDVGRENLPPLVENGFLELRSLVQDLFQPAQFTVGAALKTAGGWTFTLDASFHRWSQLTNPSAQIDVDADLGDFNDLVEIPMRKAARDPQFHDILIPRLGIEAPLYQDEMIQMIARGGYSYEPTVAPEQTGETNFVDNDKHTVSTGLGIEFDGLGSIVTQPVSFDLYMALTVLPERSHRKLSPIDPVGDYRAGGWIAAFGMSSRWRF